MGIADITIPTVEVKVSGGSFPVRGLNLFDLELLMLDCGEELSTLFDVISGRGNDEDSKAVAEALSGDLKTIALRVVRQFPGLIARTICLAADDYSEETVAKISKFPITIHYHAIIAILSLSLDVDGDPKKVWGVIAEMLGGYNDSLKEQAAELVETVKTP